MLFLPKEEDRHERIHLQSRLATFWLQFLQRLQVGLTDFKWCIVEYVILHNLESLGLDKTLFNGPYEVEHFWLASVLQEHFKGFGVFLLLKK